MAKFLAILVKIQAGDFACPQDLVQFPSTDDLIGGLPITGAGLGLRHVLEAVAAHVELVFVGVDEILVVAGVVLDLKNQKILQCNNRRV